MAKEFCPRCGCYISDTDYQCPECGYKVREMPEDEFSRINNYPTRDQTRLVTAIFKDKWFYIGLILALIVTFAITFFWRFSFLFLCFPLFIPMGRFSIASGVFFGICLGSIIATVVKIYWVTPTALF